MFIISVYVQLNKGSFPSIFKKMYESPRMTPYFVSCYIKSTIYISYELILIQFRTKPQDKNKELIFLKCSKVHIFWNNPNKLKFRNYISVCFIVEV